MKAIGSGKSALPTSGPVLKAEVLAKLPKEVQLDAEGRTHLAELITSSGKKIVVLDDDPTGNQTVHDVPVLTDWSMDSLRCEFKNSENLFFILTNTRSMTATAAKSINQQVTENLKTVSRECDTDFVVLSRSDSTLRGHLETEVETLSKVLGPFDGILLIPFFEEGRRYTIHNVHYVAEGEKLIPAGETPFAKDQAFGFKSSELRHWIAEKYNGRIKADDVKSISLEDIRIGGPEKVEEKLLTLKSGSFCVVNAASYADLDIFSLGLLRAEKRGGKYLYRTAASFVGTRANIPRRQLLQSSEMVNGRKHGGLIVVGSYVSKTTEQLNVLLSEVPELSRFELRVNEALFKKEYQSAEIGRIVGEVTRVLEKGKDALIYTSRDLLKGNNAETGLALGNEVSAALVEIVQSIKLPLKYLIAKGGITSSDLATKALGVKRAMVLGQILPGVPVWKCGSESIQPGLPYIVFPGNVGDKNDLANLYQELNVPIP